MPKLNEAQNPQNTYFTAKLSGIKRTKKDEKAADGISHPIHKH
jgi:hypothetical protein